ncbi:acyltransferase family protein [Variovorax sp. S12S4]
MLHPKYRPDIDGLRAIAVASVVIYHAFPGVLPGGFIGVDIFFVISGFLISTILLQSQVAGDFSYRDFYARRIRRIFPALILVLLATLCFGWYMLLSDEFAQLGKQVTGGAAFFANFVFWADAGYFDTAAETKPLLHLWSLGIEEQFYIFWPVLLGVA